MTTWRAGRCRKGTPHAAGFALLANFVRVDTNQSETVPEEHL